MPGPTSSLPCDVAGSTPAKVRRPDRPASCPPRVVSGALNQISNSADADVARPATPILDAAWSGVVTGWVTHATAAMRDAPDPPPAEVPTLFLWRAYNAAAWGVLPSTLPPLLESSHLCTLFGLNAPLPDSLCAPLLEALRGEMARSAAEEGRPLQGGDALLEYFKGCMKKSAKDVLDNPLLQPLFEALHKVAMQKRERRIAH